MNIRWTIKENEDKIRDAVSSSNSIRQVVKKLGLNFSGGENNKNNADNNVKLLCPNCHSQTDNYRNRKRK